VYYCVHVSTVKVILAVNCERVLITNSKLCYFCEDIHPATPDSSEDYLMVLVACLSIAGVALIIILVICLKKRSYGEWKSMDILSLGT
jgi:hypothetical protein